MIDPEKRTTREGSKGELKYKGNARKGDGSVPESRFGPNKTEDLPVNLHFACSKLGTGELEMVTCRF